MMIRLTLLAVFISALACGCAAKSEADEPVETVKTTASVGTHRAMQHEFHRRIDISADILADKQVTVISKVPGEVKKVFVSEGDRVKKGDVLVKLDQKDFRLAARQAKAQLAAAKAGVEAAEIGLETVSAKYGRLARLRDKQVISESDYEDIQGTQRSTQAQVSLAKAQVQLAQVGLDSARANLEYTEIRAAFDGEVAKRMVDEGARLNAMPPTPIAVLVDISRVKIVGAVTERDLPFVSEGMPVRVTVDAMADHTIEAKVERVEPIVDPKSRTAAIQVVLDNEQGNLTPGMSARLLLDLGARTSVAVPDDVVIRSEIDDRTGVLFVVKNNKAIRKKVVLGVRDGEFREISEGLEPDEMVVRGGQEKLTDGQAVILDSQKESSR